MHNALGTNDASYQENNRLTYNPITQLNQRCLAPIAYKELHEFSSKASYRTNLQEIKGYPVLLS